MQPTKASLAGWPSPPGARLSSSPCQRMKQLGGERRRRAWPPPACSHLPDVTLETPCAPQALSASPRAPLLLWLSRTQTTGRCHRHRRAQPRPSPLPRLSVMSKGSASTPRSPKTKHAPAERNKRRHHPHPRCRTPEIPLAAPLAPAPPRAR